MQNNRAGSQLSNGGGNETMFSGGNNNTNQPDGGGDKSFIKNEHYHLSKIRDA